MELKNTRGKNRTVRLIAALCMCMASVAASAQAAWCAGVDDIRAQEEETGYVFFERFTFGLEAVTVLQGSVNNNHNWKRVPGYPTRHDREKLQVLTDLKLEARLWQGASALARVEAADGTGLSRQAGGLTGVNDNVKDFDEKVAEFWIEQALFDERLVITLGRLDPFAYFDTNEVANNERGQFLSSQFVNSLAIDSPEYAYGARITVTPLAWIALSAGVFEDGRKFANISKDRLSIGELAVMPELLGRAGTYRIYAWHNSSDHEKLRNPQNNNESGTGFGISFDQYLTDNVCAFARWGRQSSDIYEAKQAWSLGVQVAGSAWQRPDDVFGLAYGRAVPGGAFRDQLRADAIRTADEGRIEAYYNFKLNKHIFISPDIQVAHNLTGARKANTVTTFGLRLHVVL
ncbi:MAG: carbohydrate porin [Deltaproteobacteria bacterium]|nr:carbohydrate porin [Deltaproteobacteria bacterium]